MVASAARRPDGAEQGMRERTLRPALAAVVLALAVPGVAMAHDTYVDRSDGDDGGGTNDCSAKGHPCATLGRGIDQAGTGDTVFVGGDPTPFTVPKDLGDGKSIVHKDFSKKHSVDTSGKTVLDTGAASSPALEIVSDAGRVKGLTIRSLATYAVQVDGAARIIHDRFDEEGTHAADIGILGGSAPVEVTHDKFKDSTPLTGNSEGRIGVVSSGTGEILI